jgi:glycine/D-amino acid oxidase-like deaminating enzyme
VTGRDYDFAIVGGGLVGTAVAWGLARLGQRVAVLDQGDRAYRAYRASRGNFGLVWVQSKGLGMPDYAAWTKRSADCWPGFAAELAAASGVDVAYRRPGGFDLALSEAELEARAGRLKRLHAQPNMVRYAYEILERRALERLLPQIGPAVVGASYCPLDGHCSALRLLRALHADMHRRGVAYMPNREVAAIVPRGDGAFRLVGNGPPVDAGRVVLAAGIGNAALAPMLGLTAPVRPQRGQIIVTERLQPFLDYPMATVRQTDEGGVLIGDSAEEAGFDDSVGLGVAATMAQRAIRMFPLLARANAVRVWAALRLMTQDGFPIYEQSASCPGAFIVTCHSGVTLAAGHALVLAPMLAGGRLDAALAPFGTRRFATT